MKNFLKPTKFKLLAVIVVFLFVFFGMLIFEKTGYGEKLFSVILTPGIWLTNQVGQALNLGRAICPYNPPCFTVYPVWLSIFCFFIVLYFFTALLELLFKIAKRKNR